MSWAYAVLPFKDIPLFTAISSSSMPMLDLEFTAQQMANTAWAFATLKLLDVPFFAAISSAARTKIGDSYEDSKALTTILWALS